MKFLVPGQPRPKQRPRTSKGRFYSPTGKEEDRIKGHLWAQMRSGKVFEGDLEVFVYFWRKNKVRADLDNLLKTILDAANGIIWKDDRQIVTIHAYVDMSKDPRTELEVFRVAGRYVDETERVVPAGNRNRAGIRQDRPERSEVGQGTGTQV